MAKTITLPDILTDQELTLAWRLYHSAADESFIRTMVKRIINPNIERINKATGQENDPKFLAYMIEYVFFTYTKAEAASR